MTGIIKIKLDYIDGTLARLSKLIALRAALLYMRTHF